MNRLNFNLLSFILFACFAVSLSAQEIPAYKNTSLSFEERTKDLISRMTIEEKAAQMSNDAPAIEHLGLPNYNYWSECLHGLARAGKATVFPQAIGLAATFDVNLVKEISSSIGDEARAFYSEAVARGNTGGLYTGLSFYTPNVNIYRDPRWGRGQETYGEDPFLTSQIGIAFVQGLQGNDPKYLKATACAKHYAVHSGPEKLRHVFDAEINQRDLYETYLPAFKALVKVANVESVMGAYNRVNGESASASPTLLQKILRDDWGFEGYVTSDCGAVADVFQNHKIVETPEEAAALAANSGLNLNCGWVYKGALAKAVHQGLVKEEVIDELLFDLLISRFKLGLFDDPASVPFNNVDVSIIDSEKHKKLAYDAAVKSVVLLQNKNNVLPLKKDINHIYVTGPNATNADALLGNYYGASDRLTTFFEGFVNRAPAGAKVEYRQGVILDRDNINPIDWASGESAGANVTIACIGLTSLLEGEEGESLASPQAGDMVNNAIPASQIEYIRKLKNNQKNGQPLVVVMTGGTPVQLEEISEIADAVLYSWYPGESGGYAVADIVLGNVSPSGKSPLTFVKDVNKLPDYAEYKMTGRTYRYMTDTDNIMYPFGFGLSYAEFEYSNLVMPDKLKAGEELVFSVKVKNVSKIAADEVIQVYVSDLEASVEVPIRRLAAFDRISLAPGEEKVVEFAIDPVSFSLITDDVERLIEAGQFLVSVGGGQPIPSTKSYVTKEIKVKGKKKLEL